MRALVRGPISAAFLLAGTLLSVAQQPADVTAHLESPGLSGKTRARYAAIWLVPLGRRSVAASILAAHKYTLLQREKMFSPHLLIVQVGAVVSFPNADPFFHNVFSLFDGKRFDLGLYEAGSAKEVTFSREGVSYIFCNIHPEMSAVVLALSTPYFSSGDDRGVFHLHGVPPGSYQMHVWVEGAEQNVLSGISHTVALTGGHEDLGSITVPVPPRADSQHTNKFGQAYDRTAASPY